MTSNEHDDPATEGTQPAEHVNGAASPVNGEKPKTDSGALGNGDYDEYATSGANPFSSAYPHETGTFRRLAPREFPEDETPANLPMMEQLPDPNALPDPGYPVMTGYEAFPPVASAFPPAAEPETQAAAEAAEHPSWSSGSSWPSAPSAPTWEEQASSSQAYQQSPDPAAGHSGPASPYQAPRAPNEAPPLRGSAVPLWEVQAAARHEEAPPLTGSQPAYTAQPAAPPQTTPPADASPAPTTPPSPVTPPAPVNSPSMYPSVAAEAPARQQAHAVPGADPRTSGYPVAMEPLSAPTAVHEPLTHEPPVRETADSLTTDMLLQGKRPAPGVGWRRTVYRASGGLIKIGESAANLRRRDLINRVRTPVAGGHHRVAVMSLKGGVGKTTAAVGLGATLASLRGDRVIAVDGNPDRGTLSDKVRLETSATIRDLLNERAQVSRYADVRAFTSQSSSRLEILASDRDPGVSVAFSADDYRAVARVLEHYYSICITDCGTGLLHSAMAGILELADQIVLVSSPSVDGARSASATLDWLEAHDYGDLVRNGVVVLSTIRPRSKSNVDLDRLEQHFAARSRAVVRIPYDPHLEEGAEVELEMLNSDTADAYLTLAAIVGDGFAVPRRPAPRVTRTAPLA
jgi:MinD-like ATPase involved in chromosome partitioning or flagellar assembly